MHWLEKNTRNWRWLLALGLLAYGLGVWGYYLHLAPGGATFFDAAYRTFSLFQMHYEGKGVLPWQLEVARFLAPAVMLATVGKIAFSLVRAQWGEVRIRWFWAAHHVVVGSGPQSRTLIEDIVGQRENVILLSELIQDCADDSLWGEYSAVVHRLSYDAETWRSVRLDRARSLTVLTDDDELNLEIIRKTQQWSQNNRPQSVGQLQAFCRFSDHRIRQLLCDQSNFFTPLREMAVSAFNPYQRAAREILREHPAEGRLGQGTEMPAVHVLLTGSGLLAENIVVWIALTGHFAHDTKARITLFDPEAAALAARLHQAYPALSRLLDLVALPADPEVPASDAVLANELTMPFTSAYFCAASGAGNLLAANRMAGRLGACERLVVFEQHAQFAELLCRDAGAGAVQSAPVIYDFRERVCTKNGVMQEDLDRFAHYVADRYYQQATEAWGMHKGQTPAVYPWKDLSEEWRDANRTQYDHLGVKLRSIGAEEVEINAADADFRFTPAQIESLARMEHCRWVAQRSMYGWTYGESRSDQNRQHPELVDWAHLNEKTRQKVRDSVVEIPQILAGLGRGVRRLPRPAVG